MALIKLQDKDLAEFKRLMHESFQLGYEEVFGKSDELILPKKDIDECLNKENCHAYVLKDNHEILGEVVDKMKQK